MTGELTLPLDLRRRDFRRMVVVSAAAHVGALAVALVTPSPRSVVPPRVISVDLVAAPAQARSAAKPAPRAVPPAPAPKPKPKPKQVVLPEKPSEPKVKPKPDRQREVVIDQTAKTEKSLEDLLEEFREEQGEEAPAPATPQQAAVPSAAASSGAGVRVSPEVLAWVKRAKVHVRRAWVVPPGFRTQALETHVVVKLDAAGNVVGEPNISKSSGNPWFDEGVVRGIEKASPLPAPPEAGDWDFVFAPEDSY